MTQITFWLGSTHTPKIGVGASREKHANYAVDVLPDYSAILACDGVGQMITCGYR
jgi:hypothetical protein